MRERIWYTLTDAKYNSEYTCLLAASHRNFLKWYNVFILVFSTTGILGWKVFENYSKIVCGIVAVLSLLKLVEQHIMPNDTSIQKMDTVTSFYSGMVLKMENIWYKLNSGSISDNDAFELMQELQRKEIEMNGTTNQTFKKPNLKIAQQAQDICNDFFRKIYNTAL